MRVREYGTSGPVVVVLHGGPGAPGTAAPLARGLAEWFRVLEPLQRTSGDQPLTVALHVADLHELVESRCGEARPALVGHSWGAMLALAYATAHPGRVGSMVFIGCGTFDQAARDRMRATLDERTDEELRQRMERLEQEYPDPDQRLRAVGDLMDPLYTCDPICSDPVCSDNDGEGVDGRGHDESWEDMLRLQGECKYPAGFAAIDVPVLMLHGAFDPHPGQMIRASLEPYLPHLEYREWERCGHEPWRERAVREDFFVALREWFTKQFAKAGEA